jgi:hypothetical protein
MQKRRPLSLIEVAIVMVLAAILLGVLFHTQVDMASMQAKAEKAKAVVMGRHRLLLRLNQIITSDTHFRFDNDRLVLKYDNGIDYQRNFSGRATSMLYLEEKKLWLATWASDDTYRTETVMEGVDAVSFHFFDNKKNAWSTDLPEKFTLFKIVIDTVEFPFFL